MVRLLAHGKGIVLFTFRDHNSTPFCDHCSICVYFISVSSIIGAMKESVKIAAPAQTLINCVALEIATNKFYGNDFNAAK